MRTRYTVALDGVELESVSPEIYVTDIAYGAPVREIKTMQLAGRNGQVLTGTTTGSVSVAVYFEIHERDVRRRAEIMEQVQRWAMAGGMLTTGDRPERRLRVVCESPPVIGSALKWTQACSIGFTAYAVPFWEDAYPTRVTISGNGSKSVYTPGFAAPACVECEVKNTGSSAVSTVSLSAGQTSMQFTGLSLAAGQTLVLAHDERGLLTARIGQTSVLAKRTAASSDELELEAQQLSSLSVTANGTASTTFSIRGRYA